MANPFLGQILGSVLGGTMAPRGRGPMGMPGGGLGSMGGIGGLGGMGGMGGLGRMGGAGGGRNMMLAMLLPLAMQWVQRNGGVGNVLQRFRQQGYAPHADSWVSTGDNQELDPQAIRQVVGDQDISQVAQQLGVPEDEVSGGFAEILPQMVDRLSPQGHVPQDADHVLGSGLSQLEQTLRERAAAP